MFKRIGLLILANLAVFVMLSIVLTIVQMIFGVNTLPEYRRHGYAGQLLRRAVADARQQGRRGLVLTCKERLLPYYAKFGFQDEGVTDKSTHGNVAWHQMRLSF